MIWILSAGLVAAYGALLARAYRRRERQHRFGRKPSERGWWE